MALEKIEGVRQIGESLSKQSVGGGEVKEAAAPSGERFQGLMSAAQPLKPPSFERVDPGALIAEMQQTEDLQKNPLFSEEASASQKGGSATDQEGQKKQQQEEIEELEELSAVKSKDSGEGAAIDGEEKGIGSWSGSQVSPESIKAQTREVVSRLDQVKKRLSEAQGEIKPSYQVLLRNRLTHIDDNVRVALNKAGVEYTPLPATSGGLENSNPLKRFINMVAHGQRQLENFHQQVDALTSMEGRLAPADMLAIQIKMHYVQQEIELFTSLLNKALESTKTVMNVQV